MIWFVSDTHFRHKRVLSLSNRPFSTIEEHDSYLINQINKYVKQRDTLYHLGDYAFSDYVEVREQIKCENIHLIAGNHDEIQRYKKLLIFCRIWDVCEMKYNHQKIFLSHYPHAYWPSSHYGSYHLYGHMHGQREQTLDDCFPGRRSMDVGVDCTGYRPISIDEVYEKLSQKPGHDDLSFYKDLELEKLRKTE